MIRAQFERIRPLIRDLGNDSIDSQNAGRSFNHSLVPPGFVAGGVKRGDSKGRRDAYSAIVWYWRGEELLASISPNRQAPKDVELEKRTYFPSWIGFTSMTRALV